MKTLGIVFSNIHDKEVSELTTARTLASVPYAGRYRLIDFVLSNMVNSGIYNVGVITKYNYQSLMEHVGSGKSWDLSRKNGGLVILPPYGRESSTVYSSRFEAISNIAYYLREATETYVLMSDCDNVCNIDFSEAINYHVEKHAKRRHQRVYNILIINRKFLLSIIDNAEELGYKSFSRDVLIKGATEYNIYGYEYKGYFASIDTMANYYKHSMELLDKNIRDEVFRDGGAIYKYNPTTKGNFKVIADACSDFWFEGGYMWYSSYNLTNYDLYKREMKSGAEAIRVSKNRIDALTFAGDYIYYVDNGATANRLKKVAKASLDYDAESVQVGKDNVNYQALTVVGNKLYYCTNPTVRYKKFCYIDVNAGSGVAGTEVKEGETFTYLNGKFYVYNQKDKELYAYNPNGGATAELQTKVTIVDIVNDGTNVFFASNTKDNEGLYKLTVASGKVEKIHAGAVDGLGSTSKGITFLDVKITYASEMPVAGGVGGTGYLYLYNGTSVTALNKK